MTRDSWKSGNAASRPFGSGSWSLLSWGESLQRSVWIKTQFGFYLPLEGVVLGLVVDCGTATAGTSRDAVDAAVDQDLTKLTVKGAVAFLANERRPVGCVLLVGKESGVVQRRDRFGTSKISPRILTCRVSVTSWLQQ